MNSDSNQQRNIARVHESLTEIHILMAALEAQIKSGLFPAQLEIKAVEFSMPKTLAPDMEGEPVLADRF